jgi:hypothetical protein
MLSFEEIRQLARDARANGRRDVMLPADEFIAAREMILGELRGNRLHQAHNDKRRRFSAWGIEFRQQLEVVQR